ncbi:response regulator transcription factor [Pseudoxanthomonas koreensis]|uniref:response regulator transcription factor n=1 Tax=Pseudoxanthomonas koreensis TaxID=266061 RepID=UPI0035A61335
MDQSLEQAIDDTALTGLRIAVVEDDPELRHLLVAELSDHGAAVAGLPSAEALYRHLSVHPCDIVLLDLMLPGEDGYSVAAHLRQASQVGIVMLTGRGGARDMARGLEDGADLYLVKPVDLGVLVAAMASLRRRLEVPAADTGTTPLAQATGWRLQAGGWQLQAPDGSMLDLGAAERAFLETLISTPGQAVDREMLISRITSDPWDFDPHRLEVLVHRLRARVRRLAGSPLPVRAVRGAGYLWVPDPG